MKKVSLWLSILILIPLAACSYSLGGTPPKVPVSTPTLSPDTMQTQINQLLTAMPTNTGEAQTAAATPTKLLPTVAAVTATEGSAPRAATATTIPAATNTTAPTTAAATATQAAPTATSAATAATAAPTQPSGPTFTPAPGDPRTRLGNPTSTDHMDNATTWVWPTGFDKYTSANFNNGVQTITALTTTDGWRMANPTGEAFSNIYLETTFRTGACTGSDHYGIFARVPVLTQPTQGYLFAFTCDGKFSIRRWDAEVGPKGEMKRLVDWKTSTAIATGANQTNRMGVMTVGNRLLLYANGTLLADVRDSTFPSGNFGVMLGSQNAKNFTIQVDEMSYWLNPQP